MLKSFIISEGCKPTGPIRIHLYAPLTSIPIPGMKTMINKRIPSPKNNRSKVSQNAKGIARNNENRNNPTIKWMNCFLVKFKGSPVKESENSIDAVATAKRPNRLKKRNSPKKIKSIFLKSGSEKYFSKLTNMSINKIQLTP